MRIAGLLVRPYTFRNESIYWHRIMREIRSSNIAGDRCPPVTHPIVRTHPVTGRKCLNVMRDDCTGIEGIKGWEAETLIAALADHIVKPAFVYPHQWRVGDLLMWDGGPLSSRELRRR